jgi:hypothetical protein
MYSVASNKSLLLLEPGLLKICHCVHLKTPKAQLLTNYISIQQS